MNALRACAVVDLGFGDAGKGLATDHLTRATHADVVVRFNGGAQAGHNVVTDDGRHHTFAQFGAGSFVPGVRTFLSRFVVVHPTALLREAVVLEAAGVPQPLSRLVISEHALLVTPFHQAANRLRELARGDARHGSCGVGIGETVSGSLVDPSGAVRARDLLAPPLLARKLSVVRERLNDELRALSIPRTEASEREWRIFDSRDVPASWCDQVRPVAACVAPDELLAQWLSRSRSVVFEGAQGILLDETLGFHPHTTWSDCTANHARELLAEAAPDTKLEVWGVLRAHAVRHGAGPLPTETRELDGLVFDHNAPHAWQGPVRYGWFDAVLARYALALTPQIDALLLTHVDALARRAAWPVCDAYTAHEPIEAELVDLRGAARTTARAPDRAPERDVDRVRDRAQQASRIHDVRARSDVSLQRQERLGALLARCRPELESVPGDERTFLAHVEDRLGRDIDAVSRGPRARDVELRAR